MHWELSDSSSIKIGWDLKILDVFVSKWKYFYFSFLQKSTVVTEGNREELPILSLHLLTISNGDRDQCKSLIVVV